MFLLTSKEISHQGKDQYETSIIYSIVDIDISDEKYQGKKNQEQIGVFFLIPGKECSCRYDASQDIECEQSTIIGTMDQKCYLDYDSAYQKVPPSFI
jgi:hypothetical protein